MTKSLVRQRDPLRVTDSSHRLSLSPDGDFLCTSHKKLCQIWDLGAAEPTVYRSIATATISGFTSSGDIWALSDHMLTIRNPNWSKLLSQVLSRVLQQKRRLAEPGADLRILCCTKSHLVTSVIRTKISQDYLITECPGDYTLRSLQHPFKTMSIDACDHIALSPTGIRVGAIGKSVYQWSPGEKVQHLSTEDEVHYIVVSSSGTIALASDAKLICRLPECWEKPLTANLSSQRDAEILSMEFSPDGRYLAVRVQEEVQRLQVVEIRKDSLDVHGPIQSEDMEGPSITAATWGRGGESITVAQDDWMHWISMQFLQGPASIS